MLSDTKRTEGLKTELSCLCNLLHSKDGKLDDGPESDSFFFVLFLVLFVWLLPFFLLVQQSKGVLSQLFINTLIFKIGSQHCNRLQTIILCLITAEHRHQEIILMRLLQKKNTEPEIHQSQHNEV